MDDHSAKLTHGSIPQLLYRLSIPMFFGIVASISFNLIDAFFVGQLGAIPLAAIGFTFPVIFVFGGISFGLGIGASVVISRAIGENNRKKVKRLTSDSLLLALVVVFFFILIGYMTIDPVFRLLGADSQTLPLIRSYMQIWYPGMFFLVIPIVGNNAIRANGDTKTAGKIMLMGVVVNTVLDPLLIFGFGIFPRLEIAGAALATVIARAMTLIYSLYVLYKREQMLDTTLPAIRDIVESWKQILHIGLPTSATNLIRPFAAAILTRLIAGYGTDAVAAYGVATRIDLFAMSIIMALTSVLGPFVGQNIGAGEIERVRKGVTFSQQFSMIWGIVSIVFFWINARWIAPLFSENEAVVNYLILYLSIVPFGHGFYGIFNLSTATLNVLKKPLHAALLTVVQIFVLLIPLAYVGSQFSGLDGLFFAIPLTFFLSSAMAFFWLRKQLHRLS